MEIPQHFVTPTAPNEADDISTHSGTEERHGSCRPKGTCRDIFMGEAKMGSQEEFDNGLEVGRDHSGDHVCPTSPRRLKTGDRGVRGGAMLQRSAMAPSA